MKKGETVYQQMTKKGWGVRPVSSDKSAANPPAPGINKINVIKIGIKKQ